MIREDIIKLADQQGLVDYFDLDGDSVGELMLCNLVRDCIAAERNRTWTQDHWTEYERSIAAAAKAEEREACARVCDETLAQHYMKQTIPARDESLLLAACADCAAAIRARGETK